MPSRFDRLLVLLPGWLAFMLYLPSLSHGFVWDDTYFLTDMPFLRDPGLWWQELGKPLFVSRNYFRPLPLLTFVAEARASGVEPFLFHLTNVAFHAANTTLVVLLARALLPKGSGAGAAALAGLLFAVHPALVENVCWVSDRFDLMMAFFLLLGLLAERRLVRPAMRAGVIGMLFLAALLSKETAVIFIVLLPLWQLLPAPPARLRDWPQHWRAAGNGLLWAALSLALLAYLAVRYAALGYLYQSDAMMVPGDPVQHLLLIGKTLGWYAVLAVLPFGRLGPAHPAPTPVALDDLGAWLGLCGAVGLVAVLLGLLLRKPDWRAPALAGFMVLAALAPVANLVPLTIADNLVHDRYLLLPVAFLALALALTLPEGSPVRFPRRLSLAGIWALAAVIAVSRMIPHWESNLSLWSWAYTQTPESRLVRESYLSALVNDGRNEETVALATRFLSAGVANAATTHNLGLALARLGRLAEAEQHALRAAEQFPSDDVKGRMDLAEAWNLLGYIYLQQGRTDEAERVLRQAIASSPYLTRPHYNLALALYGRREWEAGDRELAFAVQYGTPELAEAHRRLAMQRKKELQAAR